MSDDLLYRELTVSAMQALRQFDYPTMPKIFHTKLKNKAMELAREVHYQLLSSRDAFKEVKDFAFQQYAQIYYND